MTMRINEVQLRILEIQFQLHENFQLITNMILHSLSGFIILKTDCGVKKEKTMTTVYKIWQD